MTVGHPAGGDRDTGRSDPEAYLPKMFIADIFGIFYGESTQTIYFIVHFNIK